MTPPDALDLTLDELIAHDLFVRRLARTLTANAAAADDVAQDAWFAAMKKPPRPGSNLRAWLAGVVRRLAWKAHRSDMRRGRREERAARQETDGSSAAEFVAAESTRAALVAAVMRLEEPFRESVLLRYFKAMEPTEIARRTGVPAGTVRHRLFVAVGRLRVDLDAAHDGSRDRWLAALTPLGAPAFLGASVGEAVAEGVGAVSGLGATSAAGTLVGTSAGGAIGGALILTTNTKLALAVVASILAVLAWSSRDVDESAQALLSEQTRSGAASRDGSPISSVSADSTAVAENVAAIESIERIPFKPETSASEAFGSLRVTTTRNGAAIGGVAVTIQSREGPDRLLHRIRLSTDEHGVALIPRFRAGLAAVFADVGVFDKVAIVANREAQLELRLNGGFTLVGRVVDTNRRPIAGALVAVGGVGDVFHDPPTTICDGSGEFRLETAISRLYIAAKAPDYLSSAAIAVQGGAGDRIEITIQLTAGGGSVQGRCFLPDGAPAAGARVRARTIAALATAESRTGANVPPMPSPTTTADSKGRFRFVGLPPGRLRIEARAAGTALAFSDVALEEAAESEVEIRLTDGVVVEGTVSLPDGAPAVGAGVEVGVSGDFGSTMVKTDGDGRYRLRCLTPGDFVATARLLGVGEAKSTVLASVDGATIRWDAKLDEGATLRVRVVNASGAPVVDAFLEAELTGDRTRSNESASSAFSTTNAEGRATFANLSPGNFFVRVFDRARGPHAVATASGTTGGPELLLTIAPEHEPSCFVVGRLVDGEGAPVASAEISATRDGSSRLSSGLSDKDGRFKVGPLLPGKVRVAYGVGRFGAGDLGIREMAQGETWDLGDMRLQPPGELIVRVASKAASERATAPMVSLRSAVGDADEMFLTENSVASIALAPGRYFVAVVGWSTDCADIEATVEIVSGATTTVDLAPPKGAPVQVRLKSAMPRVGEVVADVDVFDSSGRLICRRRAASRHSGGERFDDLDLRLAPGSYVVRASSLGSRGEAVIEVSSADVDATSAVDLARPPLVIELR